MSFYIVGPPFCLSGSSSSVAKDTYLIQNKIEDELNLLLEYTVSTRRNYAA
jgi:hypothetical protein